MTIPIPENEQARLEALWLYDILDTEAEELLDDLTQLAAQICEVPISLISLIDSDRQWFKSRVGLKAIETPREQAFCAHAIMDEELLIVPDATRDTRFVNNPLVTGDPNIRFYAGMPLQTPSGYNLGTLCVIDRQPRDLTNEQKAVLKILSRQVMAHLEIRLRNKELEVANQAAAIAETTARKANQAKSEFLAHMSHEIRTPLNAIISMAELLQTTPLTSAQKDYLQTLRLGGASLLTVINDILDFSKIEAGRIDLEKRLFSIMDCVTTAVNLIQVQAEAKNLPVSTYLEASVPAHIVGDEVRLRQVLVNLLGNAVKFTEKGSVTLTVSAQPLEGFNRHEIHFAVRDTGIGIPLNKQDKLFQPFSQVDTSTTREYGGTGLGLVISKKLVEHMEGRIWIESQQNVGSSFHFTIRTEVGINKDDGQSTVAPPSQADGNELIQSMPRHVLLVEDNLINQKVARVILERLGCQVDLATNGEEAIQALSQQVYDVVLMDGQMPVLDGIAATQRIRGEFSPETQPYIIFLTANTSVENRQACLDAGANDYISKPFQLQELVIALQKSV